MIQLDDTFIKSYVKQAQLQRMEQQAQFAHTALWHSDVHRQSKGWLQWPTDHHNHLLLQIDEIAQRFREKSSLVIIVGIGGSYLGAKAALSMMKSPFVTALPNGLEVVFAGHQLSAAYMANLLALLEQHEVTLVVVSKSGATLEPSAAFHILRTYLEQRYGSSAHERICVITDPEKGALRSYALEKGYSMLPIPLDIGGRYSVLTAVGLLPMKLAGIDISRVLAGAQYAHQLYQGASLANPALSYALYRHILYQQGFSIEAFITYEPAIGDFALWWQQLFGESQGKDGIGLFPTMLQYTTDLHSMGQYVQDARKLMFETVLDIDLGTDIAPIQIPKQLDAANQHLAGRRLQDIQPIAIQSVRQVHSVGGVPNLMLKAAGERAELFGELVLFFEIACALGGYLLGIHPFDQPGVEGYKQEIMRRLL